MRWPIHLLTLIIFIIALFEAVRHVRSLRARMLYLPFAISWMIHVIILYAFLVGQDIVTGGRLLDSNLTALWASAVRLHGGLAMILSYREARKTWGK